MNPYSQYPVQQNAPPMYSYAPPFAVQVDPHPQRKQAAKAVNRVCLVTLMQTVASFVFAFPIVFVCAALGVDLYGDSMAYQLFNAASVPLCTALPFVIYLAIKKRRSSDETRYLCFEHTGFFTGLLVVLIGLMVCLLANYPAAMIQDWFSNYGYNPGDSASLMPDVTTVPMLVVQLFSTAILVPVMEELAFRGVLLSSLKRFGAAFSIVVSALIFALVHLDFSNVVFAFVAGLAFGAIYYYTENLWLSIFIHALNNGFAVLGSSLPALTGVSDMTMQVLLMDVPVALGLVAVVVLAWRGLNALPGKSYRTEIPLTVKDSAAAIVRAPLFWVLLSMMLAYTTTLFF